MKKIALALVLVFVLGFACACNELTISRSVSIVFNIEINTCAVL